MSNANRIHLLSLAAGTLGHLIRDQGFVEAKPALNAVLADIESLTESGIVKTTGEVGLNDPVSEDLIDEYQQSIADQPACGCGEPKCTLIDVLLGKRSDYTVTGIVEQFVADFGLQGASGYIVEVLDHLQGLTKTGEYEPTQEDGERLKELANLGAKYAVDALAEKLGSSLGKGRKPEVHVVDSVLGFEELMNKLFGKPPTDGETRH